jgi:hypothetical protein
MPEIVKLGIFIGFTIIFMPKSPEPRLVKGAINELFRQISAIFIKYLQIDMVLVTIIKTKKFVRGFSYENYHRKAARHRF